MTKPIIVKAAKANRPVRMIDGSLISDSPVTIVPDVVVRRALNEGDLVHMADVPKPTIDNKEKGK